VGRSVGKRVCPKCKAWTMEPAEEICGTPTRRRRHIGRSWQFSLLLSRENRAPKHHRKSVIGALDTPCARVGAFTVSIWRKCSNSDAKPPERMDDAGRQEVAEATVTSGYWLAELAVPLQIPNNSKSHSLLQRSSNRGVGSRSPTEGFMSGFRTLRPLVVDAMRSKEAGKKFCLTSC
jgi:hypothetical protein